MNGENLLTGNSEMLFFGIKNFWFRIGVAFVLLAWSALFIFLFYRDSYIVDPFDPSLQGTAAYGHNTQGGFEFYSTLTAIEFGILAAVLLPFSFSGFYWIRPLILQPIFGFWFCLMVLTGMHNSGVHGLHILYLLGINAVIFVLLIASVIAEIINRQKIQSN